jgi:glycosyltransferase involved in cell wall biosynthesis
MTDDLPLVSCIMPTKDRRALAARAIEYFIRQDYPNRELIIVDDGHDRIADLARADERVRYVPLDHRLSLGAKRNLACEHARGSLIAHWDDDDWHAPRRLSYQVKGLRESGADICGTDRLLFYDARQGRALEYVYRAVGRPWLAGGTLCYRREWWRSHRFANINVGEDGSFVGAARGSRLMTLRDPTFYVALIHPGNTSPKQTGGSQWRPYATDDLRRILGSDWEGFATRTSTDAPAPVAHPRVTVSIPYFRTREQIVRAVESILAQTYANLRLVVVNDGDPEPPWDLLAHIDDPRLVRFDLSTNRGRYFADAVVVEATPDTLHLVQDSDDWSEPDRLATLLEAMQGSGAHAIVSAGFNHHEGESVPIERWDHFPARGRPLTPDNDHRLNHVGLFSVSALRAIGGYYGGERIGYDTLIGNLLLMTGEVGYVDKPLYHRLIRKGSLTLSPDTGIGTPARQAVGRSLYEVYREVYGLYLAQREGTISRDDLARRIRAIHDRRVTAADRTSLRDAARRLRALFAQQDELWASQPDLFVPRITATTVEAPSRPPLVEDRRFRWNAWTVTRALAGALADRLEAAKPKRILELGTGISTVVLAEHASRTGATLVSLEHDASYIEQTKKLLTSFGLQDQVELRLAPLEPRRCADGRTYPFYDTKLDGTFDFVLIDGPPLRHGRQAAFFALSGHLARGWEVWLDDGRREHEQQCLDLWRTHFTFDAALYDFDQKGVWILRATDAEAGQERPAVRRLAVPVPASEIAAAVSVRPIDADDRPGPTPLVSCMMPTFDRRSFVPQAISLFERQDYPNRELVIVDDGTDPIGDLIPADPRYRYVRLDRRASIGAKRNIACETAKGDIVIGWDDDDWYAPSRITAQTEPIRAGRADAVGLSESLMMELATGRYWRCTPELQGRMFAGGIVSGTLAFRRRLWLEGARFPDASLAEDASFQAALERRGARLERMEDGDLFIYVRHTTNSWRFTTGSFLDRRGWKNVPPPEFLAPHDVLAFRALRAALSDGQTRRRISQDSAAAPWPSAP